MVVCGLSSEGMEEVDGWLHKHLFDSAGMAPMSIN